MADTGRNGNNILIMIEINGVKKLVQGQISGSHEISVDTYETTHKLTPNGHKTHMPGNDGITMSVECIIDPSDSTNATYSQVWAACRAKEIIDYQYGSIIVGEKYYSGTAIITSLSESAPMADKETFSLSLLVTGDETEGTVTD